MQTVPAGSNTYKALQYSLNQETHLRVFLDNSDVPMDNNTAERAIRPFTVGLRTGAMWIPSVVPRPVPSCTVWWRPPKPTVSGFMIIWSMYSQNWLPIRMTPIVLSSQIFFPGPKWFRRSAAS